MKYSSIFILFFLPYLLLGQSKYDLRPCANVEGRSDWLKKYQKAPERYEKGADSTILYIPISIHNIGNDNGTGFFKNSKILDAFCTLNADFEQANLHFFLEGMLHEIQNSSYNAHETVLDGANMMFANNISNTINCYVVSNPAGACGYNLPYAGIALSKNCLSPNDHTWAHEIGHAFKLPHPFLGWEGGISHDNSIEHSYNEPAPEWVLYDYTYFKDTLILDTLIIDTAWVELVDRTNCHFAADGFCDTEADYLNYRWSCDADLQSTVNQTDPSGQRFSSDATLIMSYSSDECASRFTDEQVAAMRANLFDQKPNLLYNQTPVPPVEDIPLAVISPFQGEITPPENTYFEWEAIPNATHYLFELSRISTFSVLQADTIIVANSIDIQDLLNGKHYYWRVRPFNTHYFCTNYSDTFSFETGEISNTENWNTKGIQIYPNVLSHTEQVVCQLESSIPQDIQITIYDLTGKTINRQNFQVQTGQNSFKMSLNNATKGIYWLHVQTEQGRYTERLVVY